MIQDSTRFQFVRGKKGGRKEMRDGKYRKNKRKNEEGRRKKEREKEYVKPYVSNFIKKLFYYI